MFRGTRFTSFQLPARRRGLVGLSWIAPVLWAAIVFAPSAVADDPENCLFCHQYRGLSRTDTETGRIHLFFVEPDYVHSKLGPHAQLACTDCHARHEVAVVPHREVTPVNCTQTCHLSDPAGLERRFSHQNIAEMLESSVHSLDLLNQVAPGEGKLLGQDQSRCLFCHDEPFFRDPGNVFPTLKGMEDQALDRCDACHSEQIPVDIEYYLRHVASRMQPARPTLEIAQVCGVCHADPAVRAEWELDNSVASYLRSYHGKAALLGDHSTANCISCHAARGANPHQMLASEDPLSAVHENNVVESCSSLDCHPGASSEFGAAAVHLELPAIGGSLEFIIAALFIVLTVLTFGPSMLIVVLELFAIVVGRHSAADHRSLKLTRAVLAHPEGAQRLVRFTVNQRVQHWVLALLFTLLALTGFPMKFADQGWSRVVIDAFGGLDMARLLHHWAGLALFGGLFIHLAYVFWTIVERRRQARAQGESKSLLEMLTTAPLWLNVQDGKKALHLIAYLLYIRKDKPEFGRFSVKEKFEYIGVFWGTVLLGVTGVMLWGEQLVSHVLGGRVLNIALIAHTYEAFLAIIHVGILHIFNVMFAPNVFPLSRATLSGQTPTAELAEGHGEMVAEVADELGIKSDGGASHG